MRRWPLLNRLRRAPARRERERCILVVEQLESREVLSPVVTAPPQISIFENDIFTFTGSGAFFAFEGGSGNFGQPYIASLTAANGILSIDLSTATSLGVSVANNGTAAVTLTGQAEDITSLLISPGITFDPTDFFSGEASVAVALTDTSSGESDADSTLVRISPVASSISISVQTNQEVFAPASGFVFPAGFLTIGNWPDTDGSEQVRVIIQLDAPNPEAFTLSAGGVVIQPDEPGQWSVVATTPAALQTLLDSLELTPPAGFSGRTFLLAFASVRDQATYSAAPTVENNFSGTYFVGVPVRFFQGGNVSGGPVFGQEGGSVDLGGRFSASDPDELPGDSHTLTLSVPGGTFLFDAAAIPEGLVVGRDVAPNGSTTILLSGSLAAINQFLATPGSLTYTPDTNFGGVIPLTLRLANQPGDPFGMGEGESGGGQFGARLVADAPNAFVGVVGLAFVPVADRVFPAAVDVATFQDTPVTLSIGLSPFVDTDGSETVLVLLEGVPEGSVFNAGMNLGNGQWLFSPSDLAGLAYAPPPGATGTFVIIVRAMVTDSPAGLGLSDVAVESTAFFLTVLPLQNIPPDSETESAPAPLSEIAATGVDIEDIGDNRDSDRDSDRPAARPNIAVMDVYGPGSNSSLPGSAETRVSSAPPGQGSLFTQAELPLPTYAYGEKHPLPPVLPLDQTLPVAGFSESGGDSFALIDKLYRDAAGAGVSQAGAIAPDTLAQIADLVEPIRLAAASTNPTPATPEAEIAPAPIASEEGSEWRVWAAASAVAGALVAWAWLGRGTDGFLARAVRRLLRTFTRRPTQRTA